MKPILHVESGNALGFHRRAFAYPAADAGRILAVWAHAAKITAGCRVAGNHGECLTRETRTAAYDGSVPRASRNGWPLMRPLAKLSHTVSI